MGAVDVSIISDDCWAGWIYSELGLRCLSPFVGMGFTPSQYLHFLQRMRDPGALEILSVSSAERGYPIIETPHARLFGLHYHSDSDFVRRVKRRIPLIDWDNILIKIDFEKSKYTQDDIRVWNELRLPRSIAFFPDTLPYRKLNIHHGVGISNDTPEGFDRIRLSYRYFDLFEWLRSGTIAPPPIWSPTYQLLLCDNSLKRWIRKRSK